MPNQTTPKDKLTQALADLRAGKLNAGKALIEQAINQLPTPSGRPRLYDVPTKDRARRAAAVLLELDPHSTVQHAVLEALDLNGAALKGVAVELLEVDADA